MPVVQLPSTPIPPGYGRVVIDATDGPMDVVAKTDGAFSNNTPGRSGFLCRTPCVADLPLGSYKLFFSGLEGDDARGDVARLEVGEGLNVLRRAPGKYDTPDQDPALGIVVAVLGTVMLSSGTYFIVSDEEAGGVALMTVGAGAMIGGFVMAAPGPAEEQAGTTTAWNVPPQPVEASPPPPAEAPQSMDLPATGSTAP